MKMKMMMVLMMMIILMRKMRMVNYDDADTEQKPLSNNCALAVL